MIYTINVANNAPLEHWGLQAGTLGAKLRGYALQGIWSLPERLGKCYHNWQGVLEPYVDKSDIHLASRPLTLSVVCKANSPSDLKAKLQAFSAALPDNFIVSNSLLGSYKVGLQSIEVKAYNATWAQATLRLQEPQPAIPQALPVADGGLYGIDHYSWQQLGVVVKALDGRYNTPSWRALSITSNPLSESWACGYREPRTVSLEATIRGSSYADFRLKVEVLQALLSAPGVREVSYFDGSRFEALVSQGFVVNDVYNLRPIHCGRLNCKMIVL